MSELSAIAGPALLLARWGAVISAGRSIPWAATLHCEVCLHGLMHLSPLFPGGVTARTGPQKETPGAQRGPRSQTGPRGELCGHQEAPCKAGAEEPEGEGPEGVRPEEGCGWGGGEEPGAPAEREDLVAVQEQPRDPGAAQVHAPRRQGGGLCPPFADGSSRRSRSSFAGPRSSRCKRRCFLPMLSMSWTSTHIW